MKCDAFHVIIAVFYRPPDMSLSFTAEFRKILDEANMRFPNSVLIIFGDFNFPSVDWSSLSVASNEIETNSFLQTCLDFSLTQLINSPTRRSATSANILDLILTNHPDLCSNITILDGLSDHAIITGSINRPFISRKTTSKKIRCYARADFDAMNTQLSRFSDQFLNTYHSRSTEENWLIFKNTFINAIESCIPVLTIKNSCAVPWFTRALRRLNNKKKRLYRQADKNRASVSWLRYKECDKQYQSLLKSTRRNFYTHDLTSMISNNPRKFWRVINPKSYPDISILDHNGQTVPESECAQILNKSFASVFTCEDVSSLPITTGFIQGTMPEIVITEGGILSLLNKLKISSTCDHMGINNTILKNTSLSIAPVLAALFTQSLSEGSVPHDWRIGKIAPFFKSGDRSSPLNYRPISLTSTICKIIEHIIHSQVIKYLEEHNTIFKFQHGFRKGYSCETQLAGFTNDLYTSVDSGFQVDAVFLDFSKAFDRVPHHRLLLKLSKCNLHPDVLAWIKDFLTSRLQFTFVNNHASAFAQVTSGVPQGSVLGPLLFLVYINDLPSSVSSRVRLFADDLVIYRTISSDTDRCSLQSDLDTINAWCLRWLMPLNLTKTKQMSFSGGTPHFTTSYTISHNAIEVTNTYKYLGIHFRNDLKWHHHINVILASANRSLGLLRRNLKQAPSHVKRLAYVTLIRPKIEYASAIWDPHQAYLTNNLESLQNRAVRFIFSDYSTFSSVTALKQRAELDKLCVRRAYARLSLFHKIYFHPTLHSDFFQPPSAIFPRRDHPNKVKRPLCHSSLYANSFLPNTISDWNDLPSHIATQTDITKFQELLRQL